MYSCLPLAHDAAPNEMNATSVHRTPLNTYTLKMRRSKRSSNETRILDKVGDNPFKSGWQEVAVAKMLGPCSKNHQQHTRSDNIEFHHASIRATDLLGALLGTIEITS